MYPFKCVVVDQLIVTSPSPLVYHVLVFGYECYRFDRTFIMYIQLKGTYTRGLVHPEILTSIVRYSSQLL